MKIYHRGIDKDFNYPSKAPSSSRVLYIPITCWDKKTQEPIKKTSFLQNKRPKQQQ
jgi:hypothetical protein